MCVPDTRCECQKPALVLCGNQTTIIPIKPRCTTVYRCCTHVSTPSKTEKKKKKGGTSLHPDYSVSMPPKGVSASHPMRVPDNQHESCVDVKTSSTLKTHPRLPFWWRQGSGTWPHASRGPRHPKTPHYISRSTMLTKPEKVEHRMCVPDTRCACQKVETV